jgi:hypothetical protein
VQSEWFGENLRSKMIDEEQVLHIPSINPIIDMVSQYPAQVSRANECVVFAVYHFAILSLTEDECIKNLSSPYPRDILLQKYNFAARQALVNASFLKTTDMAILQAMALFLLSVKSSCDPRTFWILTGTAVRISQRMGLHRDGEKLGLPPFETQMRRRLFYQLLPLDLWAGQLAGTGIAMLPESWDTEAPWNLNDSDIWPGMTDKPAEVKGATEMMFCLARATLGRALGKAKMMNGWNSSSAKQPEEVEAVIVKSQSEVEETYLRYCDIVDPLHFLTICSARSGVNAMRLRLKLAKAEKGNVGVEERREMFELTQRTVDTDTAACEHSALKKYSWHIGGLFVWGTWEGLIFNLTTLRGLGASLTGEEKDGAWRRIEQLFRNHPSELLGSRRALHVAVRRLTLKAWDICPAGRGEPDFINTLRDLRKAALQCHPSRWATTAPVGSTPSLTETTSTSSIDNCSNSYAGGNDFDVSKQAFDLDFDLDTVDWSFWNHLIQDSQTAG